MTAAQDLMNDPVGFMEDNIVIVQMTGDTTAQIFNGTTQLKLYSRPLNRVRGRKRNFMKTAVGVYFLHPGAANVYYPDATVDPNLITAYFCPYNQNSTHGTVINNAADLCFTTQMDGCTFAVGHRTANGSRLVMHTNQANQGDPNNAWAQSNAQDQNLRQAYTAQNRYIHGMLAPTDYRSSSKGTLYQATTFGYRNNGNWEFYTQRYRPETMGPPQVYSLKEVKQFF